MRFLLFLLLGTLLFGFAFPAAILLIGVIGVIIVAIMLYRLLSGGSSYRAFTSRWDEPRSEDEIFINRGRKTIHIEEDPNAVHTGRPINPEAANSAATEADIEDVSEVIELPPTALTKDDSGEPEIQNEK